MGDAADDAESERSRDAGVGSVRPSETLPVTGGGARVGADAPDALCGRVLAGRYLLESVLGRGGMGIVYRARHLAIGRAVAVKVLRPELSLRTRAVSRFQREAQAAAAIGHPNIVQVIDFGNAGDETFLVMELLEGENLAARVRRLGRLDVDAAVALAQQVAQGLDAAHRKGIVHRDLKSENVIVTGPAGAEVAKLVDFGISRVTDLDEAGGITQDGELVGTPHYMAPEQGTPTADHRVDLYALGCLLFEMLTGRVPFTASNALDVLYQHRHAERPRPSAARGDGAVPAWLDAVVLRAMARDVDARYPDAASLLDDLRTHHVAGEGSPWRRRGLMLALAAGALGVAATLAMQHPTSDAAPPRVKVPLPEVTEVRPPPEPARADAMTVSVEAVAVAVDGGAAPSPRAPSVRPRRVEAPRVPDGLKASPYLR